MSETPPSLPRLSITVEQAEAIAALARLYMSTRTLTISPGAELSGWIVAETHKWRWAIDENGRVAGEGAIEGASDAF